MPDDRTSAEPRPASRSAATLAFLRANTNGTFVLFLVLIASVGLVAALVGWPRALFVYVGVIRIWWVVTLFALVGVLKDRDRWWTITACLAYAALFATQYLLVFEATGAPIGAGS
ncbi:MAG: hypothetical protein H0W72_06695 [Planctomycetes bacterium]|nr:hypothetical protein [Planctomycetota bacterium]